MISRLPDGTVDLECHEAKVILEAISEIQNAPEGQRIHGIAGLLPYLLELDWWEMFAMVAWPDWVPSDFAWFHREHWAWITARERGVQPEALIECWFRGAAKSTNLQMSAAWLACKGLSQYLIYLEATQASADRKVQGVATLIQAPAIRVAFPHVAEVYRDRLGKKRDWTKSRLRNGAGFTMDSLGMDMAMRGIKVDEARPDMIFVDDIEDSSDTEYMTGRKEETFTDVVIPLGSPDVGIAFVQNMIHEESIMARLCDGRAEFLTDRKVVGPVKAVIDLEYDRVDLGDDRFEYRITEGKRSWPGGPSMKMIQKELNSMGPTAFKKEKQHEGRRGDGLWTDKTLAYMRRPLSWPDAQGGGLTRIVVGVDPSVGTGEGDECGIVVCGTAEDGNSYILEDATLQAHPSAWVMAVVSAYERWKAAAVVAEINHGYELVTETIGRYAPNLPVIKVRAKQGKITRAEPIAILSEQGLIRFAGDHPHLRHQMATWNPKRSSRSPDRLDAMVYAMHHLMPVGGSGPALFRINPRGRR